MTNRKTSQWTPTVEEAFGESGVIGRMGELVIIHYIINALPNPTVEDFPSCRNTQVVKGYDIAFRLPHYALNSWVTIDAKATAKSSECFRINKENLHKALTKGVTRWWHVSLEDGGMAWYDVAEMCGYLNRNRTPQYYDDCVISRNTFQQKFNWIQWINYDEYLKTLKR